MLSLKQLKLTYCYNYEILISKQWRFELNSITNIVLHIIFYMNKYIYKLYIILIMFIYLKKIMCY
jgi:hypothetical protein